MHQRMYMRESKTREKGKRGRPRKTALKPEEFYRVGVASCAYDECRAHDEKHSTAVMFAVDEVNRRLPTIPISPTGVKRILAATRRKGSETVLLFERRTPTPQEAEKWRKILPFLPRPNGGPVPPPPTHVLTLSFGPRPSYPRHNRKNPK